VIGRSAHVATVWEARAHDLADLRAILAYVEPGSKVLAASTEYGASPPPGRVLPGVERLDAHLGALAVIERGAFWSSLFADPAQQPLAVRPPYDRLAGVSGGATPWPDLLQDRLPARRLGASRLTDWRERFDYILVIGPPPAGKRLSGVSLIRASDIASLYRIN